MIPAVFSYPVKRPIGYLHNARFEGDDEDLEFKVDYYKEGGGVNTYTFRCTDQGGTDYQQICIPNSYFDLDKLDRDCLISHVRMAGIISGFLPDSKEYENALKVSGPGQTKWFQTAMGQVKVIRIDPLSNGLIEMEFQRGSTSDKRVISDISPNEITRGGYSFSPSTQVCVVAGSTAWKYPNHEHDLPSNPLTSGEKDDFCDYVETLEIWV